jgi:aldehyde:ferredoxin oxidoreductase
MPECYSAVTGWDVDLNELLATGERIGDMRLAFSIREGLIPVKLPYPEIARGNPPFKEGPTKDITLDLELITKEFCQEMGWDYVTGKPTKDRLKKLGLEWLIKDLWG